jgi:SAM-dependent methyltransferase
VADPRAALVRAGYAPIARAYRERLGDELAGKPLDRAFLDAFVERATRPAGAAIDSPGSPGPGPGPGPGGGLIVDLGCGPGHVARYLASRGAAVEGIDLSPAMIAEATASHPGLAFRVADMFALDYESGSVAGLVAFYAIVHLYSGELVAPFREWRRVIAPGGVVAIAFHVGSDTVHVDELFGQATSLDFVFHRPEAVIAALAEAGWTLEARLDREPYPGAEHPSQRCYLLARR